MHAPMHLQNASQPRTPLAPRLPLERVSRAWPFRVGEHYLGGMPGQGDIVGRLFPALTMPQVWGDCCAYSVRRDMSFTAMGSTE